MSTLTYVFANQPIQAPGGVVVVRKEPINSRSIIYNIMCVIEVSTAGFAPLRVFSTFLKATSAVQIGYSLHSTFWAKL